MSSLTGRKVKLVRTHSTVHVIGVGSMGPAIDSNSARVLGALQLTKVEDGVLVKGSTFELFIPNGNIVSMTLEPENR